MIWDTIDSAYDGSHIPHNGGEGQKPTSWPLAVDHNPSNTLHFDYLGSSRRASAPELFIDITQTVDSRLNDVSQPQSMGSYQTPGDVPNINELCNRLGAINDDSKNNYRLGTLLRKRPPRPSFTEPPSRTKSPPPTRSLAGNNSKLLSGPKSTHLNRSPTDVSPRLSITSGVSEEPQWFDLAGDLPYRHQSPYSISSFVDKTGAPQSIDSSKPGFAHKNGARTNFLYPSQNWGNDNTGNGTHLNHNATPQVNSPHTPAYPTHPTPSVSYTYTLAPYSRRPSEYSSRIGWET